MTDLLHTHTQCCFGRDLYTDMQHCDLQMVGKHSFVLGEKYRHQALVLIRMSLMCFQICVFRDILITSVNCEISYEDFCAEIKDICKFDDKQPFTVKWVDEDGKVLTIEFTFLTPYSVCIACKTCSSSELDLSGTILFWHSLGLFSSTICDIDKFFSIHTKI